MYHACGVSRVASSPVNCSNFYVKRVNPTEMAFKLGRRVNPNHLN